MLEWNDSLSGCSRSAVIVSLGLQIEDKILRLALLRELEATILGLVVLVTHSWSRISAFHTSRVSVRVYDRSDTTMVLGRFMLTFIVVTSVRNWVVLAGRL